jgi:hypothetical protein
MVTMVNHAAAGIEPKFEGSPSASTKVMRELSHVPRSAK